jgi:hypothetical protein
MNALVESAAARRTVYALLIALAAGLVGAKVLGVARMNASYLYRTPGLDEKQDPRGVWPAVRPDPSATHGDNDRSRWDTMRALVENGTYAIGKREMTGPDPEKDYQDSGFHIQPGWVTIDKILHPDRLEFYSSKPPLLPTLLAGEYWLLYRGLGWNFDDINQRFWIVRTILFTVNWIPFVLALFVLSRIVENLGATDWGRYYVMAVAGLGTLIVPFSMTLNNHTIAAWSAVFALAPALSILVEGRRSLGLFALSGFFAGFTATNELPAASLAAFLFLLLLYRAPVPTLTVFLPAMLLPVAGFFITNYLAIGEWTPAYEKFGSKWYEFPGSHWLEPAPAKEKKGIDFAYMDESRYLYAFHLLLGHHGVFSLTPAFLLTVIGIGIGIFNRDGRAGHVNAPVPAAAAPVNHGADSNDAGPGPAALRLVGVLALVTSVVVVGYYIAGVPDRNRNYGGWSIGPRWLLWLTPLWLLAMLPAADWCAGRRWTRGVAGILLMLSVFSASLAWNPWQHPWLYKLMEELGWQSY